MPAVTIEDASLLPCISVVAGTVVSAPYGR